MPVDSRKAAEALSEINRILAQLDEEARQRVLAAVISFFNFSKSEPRTSELTRAVNPVSPPHSTRPQFSNEHHPTPKEFMFQKQPKTDVERIACLAYYLTHFRDMPHFKTLDLAKLNTEAAQTKFSNAAYAANNATNSGYLAPAAKNQRQITAAGEQFVAALPDREAAKAVIATARRRKSARKNTRRK